MDNEQGAKPEGFITRRRMIRLAVLFLLVLLPFITFFVKRSTKKRIEIPDFDMDEITFSIPKGVESGIFLPNKNSEDLERLQMSSGILSDAEVYSIRFVPFGDDTYSITTVIQFISENPDPKKVYEFELIAYDSQGKGFAYSSGKTRDLRTVDLQKEARESPSILIREMTVWAVFSLDVIMNQEQLNNMQNFSLFCTTTVSKT